MDAPCSGFGTLRRNPDLKWRHDASAVAELAAKQRDILESAARLVKPGGRLAYATCSILPEENEAVADAFAAGQPDLNSAALLAACGDLEVKGLDHCIEGVSHDETDPGGLQIPVRRDSTFSERLDLTLILGRAIDSQR